MSNFLPFFYQGFCIVLLVTTILSVLLPNKYINTQSLKSTLSIVVLLIIALLGLREIYIYSSLLLAISCFGFLYQFLKNKQII